MKNSKKIILLISCMSLIVSIIFISQIYAKYLTTVNGDAKISIAKWNIIINNQSIKNNDDISSVISPVFSGTDDIAPNIIAPSAEGYFDLNFDFSQVDVSFKYNISISPNKNSAVTDLIATGYSIDDGQIQNFSNSSQTISDQIQYSNNINSRTVRVFIKWDDSENATMTNADQTLTTKGDNNFALMNVNISFTQTI